MLQAANFTLLPPDVHELPPGEEDPIKAMTARDVLLTLGPCGIGGADGPAVAPKRITIADLALFPVTDPRVPSVRGAGRVSATTVSGTTAVRAARKVVEIAIAQRVPHIVRITPVRGAAVNDKVDRRVLIRRPQETSAASHRVRRTGSSMRRLTLTAAAAVVAFGSCPSAQGGEAYAAVPSRMTTATPREPVLGVVHVSPNSPAILARLDALSLTPVSKTLEVGEYHHAWSLSPDASQLAVARGGQGIGIQIVDLESMQLVREVRTGIAAEALGWLAPRLLVAALQRGGTVIVDPVNGRILRRWTGYSFPQASARIADGLVMLLPRLHKSRPGLPLIPVAGAPRLAVVDAQGRLQSVRLTRIRLGVKFRDGYQYADRAGLAVDAVHRRAYIFAADAPVARVDLRQMHVSYRRLEQLFLRPSEVGEGAGRARSVILSRERGARWLGNGRVILFGRDFVTGSGRKEALVPAGATLVDMTNWDWRTLDARATGAATATGRLLVYGPGRYPAAGIGVRAYTLGGRTVFALFKGKRVFDVQVAADLAYVRTAKVVHVVDVASGGLVADIVPPLDLVDVIVGGS